MKVYGHLRDSHSTAMAQKVTFSEEIKDAGELAKNASATQVSSSL